MNENRFLFFLIVDIRDMYILKKVFEICLILLKNGFKMEYSVNVYKDKKGVYFKFYGFFFYIR